MRVCRQTGREDRRSGAAVRLESTGCEPDRVRAARALPARARRLQGAQRDMLSRSTSEVHRRQNPAQRSTDARLKAGNIMTIPNYSMATVPEFVGRSLGVSEWVTVGQDR